MKEKTPFKNLGPGECFLFEGELWVRCAKGLRDNNKAFGVDRSYVDEFNPEAEVLLLENYYLDAVEAVR